MNVYDVPAYKNDEALEKAKDLNWFGLEIDKNFKEVLKLLRKRGIRFGDKFASYRRGKVSKVHCLATFLIPLDEIPRVLAFMSAGERCFNYYWFHESLCTSNSAFWLYLLEPILEARLEVGV